MTKKQQTEPYNASRIAGLLGQLIGWLQFAFIPVLLITIFEQYNPVAPLPVAAFTALLVIMMIILILKGRVLENMDTSYKDRQKAAIWSIAAALVMAVLNLPLKEFSLMYVAAIVCYIRAYRQI